MVKTIFPLEKVKFTKTILERPPSHIPPPRGTCLFFSSFETYLTVLGAMFRDGDAPRIVQARLHFNMIRIKNFQILITALPMSVKEVCYSVYVILENNQNPEN